MLDRFFLGVGGGSGVVGWDWGKAGEVCLWMEGLWHGLEVVACGWRVGGMDWRWLVSDG